MSGLNIISLCSPCHHPLYTRTFLEEAKFSMGIVACEQMRMKWLHYEIAFVNWLMKKAGSKSAGNNGVMATVKNTLIEKEKKTRFHSFGRSIETVL